MMSHSRQVDSLVSRLRKTMGSNRISVADPERVHGGSLEPPPLPHLKYLMKLKRFGLSETKLFYFYGILKKN